MFLVGAQVLHPAFLDELDHPARVEVDAEANAAAILAQMLDGQSQPPRSGWPEHQPVSALGEILLRKTFAEHLVIDAKVVHDDTTLGNPGRAAGFEYEDRLLLPLLPLPPPPPSPGQT